ncbi:MFS transporter [Bartonella sp. MM55XZML]|uniref:MFS transporter n=1 Tax=Bartonella sp. MM55XZML TaxID=3243552 RepID=UPI0035CECCE9
MDLLVAGELLDKFNERYIVGVGALGVSIALLLGAIAENYISLLVCLLIVGGLYSSAQPGGAKSVSAWFPQSQRGFAMGIRQAGLPLGGALAGMVLPASALVYGIQGAFLVGAIVSFLGDVSLLFFITHQQKLSLSFQKARQKFRSMQM